MKEKRDVKCKITDKVMAMAKSQKPENHCKIFGNTN